MIKKFFFEGSMIAKKKWYAEVNVQAVLKQAPF